MTEEFILTLMDRFNAGTMTELELNRDGTTLVLKKTGTVMMSAEPAVQMPATVTPSAPVQQAPAQPAAPVSSPAAAGTEAVKCPAVGTFYRAPSPDAPAYAEKGKVVKKGEPLCIIEAMKMMNTLTAEFDMEIVAVLPENGDLVEFDQELFTVKRL